MERSIKPLLFNRFRDFYRSNVVDDDQHDIGENKGVNGSTNNSKYLLAKEARSTKDQSVGTGRIRAVGLRL